MEVGKGNWKKGQERGSKGTGRERGRGKGEKDGRGGSYGKERHSERNERQIRKKD